MLTPFIGRQNRSVFLGLEVTWMGRLTNFFRDVAREMKKVSWPKRKELTRYTITVVTTVLFVTVFFWIVDMGISELLRTVIK
jgi:preprotein translocase subunit SecE